MKDQLTKKFLEETLRSDIGMPAESFALSIKAIEGQLDSSSDRDILNLIDSELSELLDIVHVLNVFDILLR